MEMVCDHCRAAIKRREDLVVTSKYAFFLLRKYHRKCMADLVKMKTLSSGFVRTRPINGMQETVLLAITSLLLWAIAATLPFLAGASPAILLVSALIAAIPLPGLATRIYSYLKFERPLGG